MTTRTTAADVAEQLEAGFPPVTNPENRELARTLFRQLAEGEPVEVARLAGTLRRPEAEISEALAEPAFEPLVYSDEQGRVIGFSGLGIAELGETVHRLRVDDHEVYAWCAGDALFLPATLGREMQVESRCPVTSERISLSVSPDGFREIEPPEAVMSMLSPEEVHARVSRGEDVISSLCHWTFFFASEDAAREWTAEHPGTTTFPLEEGFELGRRWIAHKWGIGA